VSEFEATPDQRAVIDAELKSMAVVACPGSGKTATAVRRVAEMHRRLAEMGSRGHVALLSFSNVAVDTFHKEYKRLRGKGGDSDKVVIQTVDSFVTRLILSPHGNRVMGCARTPYLVLGSEPFLTNYRVGAVPKDAFGIEDLAFDFENEKLVMYRRFKNGGSQQLDEILTLDAKKKIKKLAEAGGYTYSLGRVWAYTLLRNEPRLTSALARRFPHILVDEAQDIGCFEGLLLDLLKKAGSSVTLVGDCHQSIYSFNFATGEYLRKFSQRADVLNLPLNQNRRSVESIVAVANSLAKTVAKPFRETPVNTSGAFFWNYDPNQLPSLMSAWVTALGAAGYSIDSAAVLCRGNALLAKLSSYSSELGRSAAKHFAAAAIERDQSGEISKALEHCSKGVMAILSGLPNSFIVDLKSLRKNDIQIQKLRRLIWTLIRSPEIGIPKASLAAKSTWLPRLKENLDNWLSDVELNTIYVRESTWKSRVTVASLPATGPLLKIDLGQNDWSGLRCGTVHSAKGEGISAVMYLADKNNLTDLVNGTSEEEGRIGYVAATRARDLLVIAIPIKTDPAIVDKLISHGFSRSSPEMLAAADNRN
jgi:superfamily I DNA/RNA helicase